MRTLRQLCAVFVLTLTLTLSAFAGDISTTIASPPPSPTSQAAATQGDISTTIAVTGTEIVLNLILGVFSLI